MYTELNQVANYIARQMHFRVPRLKICLFSEHLANLLLLRYNGKWDDNYKEHRVLLFVHGFAPSDEITTAASAIGLSVEEVVLCLPDRLKIFINPGEVYCVIGGEGSMPKPIWMGPSPLSDEKYVHGQSVPLSLVPPRELGLDNPFPNDPQEFLMFRYVVPGSQNFTVESFSQTRFGSLRKRPDPEMLRRLQKSIIAANSPSSSGQTTSVAIM